MGRRIDSSLSPIGYFPMVFYGAALSYIDIFGSVLSPTRYPIIMGRWSPYFLLLFTHVATLFRETERSYWGGLGVGVRMCAIPSISMFACER